MPLPSVATAAGVLQVHGEVAYGSPLLRDHLARLARTL
jgi:hypothetical protein